MKVKKLAKKIEKMNVRSCGSCPFANEEKICKLKGSMCLLRREGLAEGLLVLEKFFKKEGRK